MSSVQKTTRVWQHQGTMFKSSKKSTGSKQAFKKFEKRVAPPLDAQKLADLAYWYTGKYAVSQTKARQYLAQKLKMRGWAGPEEGEGSADAVLTDVLARLIEYGAVNDQLVANSAVASARRKGLAGMRIKAALSTKQVTAAAAESALAMPDESDGPADEDAYEDIPGFAAADRFARRKRLGAYRTAPFSPERRKKEVNALIRAGHSFALAALVVDSSAPDAE
jgi:regulatory protein